CVEGLSVEDPPGMVLRGVSPVRDCANALPAVRVPTASAMAAADATKRLLTTMEGLPMRLSIAPVEIHRRCDRRNPGAGSGSPRRPDATEFPQLRGVARDSGLNRHVSAQTAICNRKCAADERETDWMRTRSAPEDGASRGPGAWPQRAGRRGTRCISYRARHRRGCAICSTDGR